jgi:hypothetical protein
MISTIIHKEFIDIDSPINIACSKIDNIYFEKYLHKIFSSSNIYTFDNTYYGNMEPSCIVCNNRISHLEKSIDLSKYFHCPLLIIDHEIKSDLITNKISHGFTISPVIQVALSKDIFLSWDRVHDYTLGLDTNDIPKWKNIIYSLCKQVFKFVPDNIKNKTYEKK